MIKSYKIRLYPTKEQEQNMWRHIGACRFIWNYMLALQEETYHNGEKHLSAFDMINRLKPLKNDGEHEWLYEISATSCQIVCQDLQKAYDGFFAKRLGFPKFKSRKRSKLNYPVCAERLWFDENGFVHIQKIGKVKFKTDFTLPIGTGNKFMNPRISYVLGKWMLSFGMESETQAHELTDKSMGIDLGLKDMMISAFGDEKIIVPNINKCSPMEKDIRAIRINRLKKKLRSVQQSISCKYEANKVGKVYRKTNNIKKLEDEARRINARIVNIRADYIHQWTHKLAEKLPKRVCMEDLDVQGMLKKKRYSKGISQSCWAEIIRQMKYKCEWYGIEFVQADKFYPSSKTCHNCGNVKSFLGIWEREYHCKECGYKEDRDFNAALNLQSYVA